MAQISQSLIAPFLIFILLISTTMAARELPDTNIKKHDDVKHLDSFFYYDRGYLIPGIGRGIKPKSKKGFNPFTYNPITGGNNGIPGFTIPSYGGVGGGSYMPGGDDTLVPNPGFEVPNPGGLGSTPASTKP